jgi:import receptor subunit TOM20
MTVAGVAVGGVLAYAVYFDYKRRTDANFRKQLRKFSPAEYLSQS